MAIDNAVDVTRELLIWLSHQRWYVSPWSAEYAQSTAHADSIDTDTVLTWSNVGVAGLLLGINVALSLWLRLGMASSIAVAAVRCIGQLTMLGMLLNQIFATGNPVYIFGMTAVLGVLAASEVTYWRTKRRFPGMFGGTFAAIMGSALLVALFGNAYALNMSPAYTAVKFIPTIGMLFGNCMIGVSIGTGSVMDALDVHRARAEAMLCFGASRWEVVRPVVVDALRNALLPTITNMGITGLISIPGVMTGWILAGADVLQAARYQQIILFMISASTASSTLLSVLFCAFVLVDSVPSLRLDRLIDTNPQPRIESRMPSRASSRLALLRSGCRPKSELYLSRSLSTVSSPPSTCNSAETTALSGSATPLVLARDSAEPQAAQHSLLQRANNWR